MDSSYTLTVGQNRYLPLDGTALEAVLAVAAAPGPDPRQDRPPEAAEIILIDCSGSMDQPAAKMTAARHAAIAAIDVLRPGTHFAVVAGNHTAVTVYPPAGGTAVAGRRSRAEATAAIRRLVPGGGTAISTWLTAAATLLAPHHTAVRHAILLTDGRNEHETAQQLSEVLARCEGTFSCDARGIGTDWSGKELLRIASMLRGSAEAIRGEEHLVDEFRALVEGTMAKRTPQLRLRVRVALGVTLSAIRQVHPAIADLTGHLHRVDERTAEVGLGAWGDEIREYVLALDVGGTGEPGVDHRVCTVEVVAGPPGAEVRQGRPEPIVVQRTADPGQFSVVQESLAAYEVAQETAIEIRAVVDAVHSGRFDEAEHHWAVAAELSGRSRNVEALRRLERLVDRSAPGARPRLRRPPDEHDLLALEVYQLRSGSMPHLSAQLNDERSAPAGPEPAETVRCPDCGAYATATQRFCRSCRRPLSEGAA